MSAFQAPPTAEPTGEAARTPGRRRTVWLCATALVLVVAALAAFTLVRHRAVPADGTAASAGQAPAAAAGQAPAAAAMARSAPQRIEIPSIDVDSEVTPLGLAADGTVTVPPIAPHSPVGWYDGSPTPGESGASVLLGHVTVGSYGKGVFYRLHRLGPGARITVVRADGSTAVFTVTRTALYPKSRFPAQAVYGATSTPQLRLVTCAVPAGPAGSGYRDNLVVYATLSSSLP